MKEVKVKCKGVDEDSRKGLPPLLIVSVVIFDIIYVHLSLQVPEYLARVDRRLKEELDRLLHYLDPSTRYGRALIMTFLKTLNIRLPTYDKMLS